MAKREARVAQLASISLPKRLSAVQADLHWTVTVVRSTFETAIGVQSR